jgi:mono/diheme cytochrome c family protein
MLKSSSLLFAAFLLVAVCVPLLGRSAQTGTPAPALQPTQAVTPAPPAPLKNPVKPTAESLAKAKSLYAIDCSMCHGDNGNGKTDLTTSMGLNMVDWTNPSTLSNKTDSDLFTIIRNGKDKMPPEADGRANDTMVWNLILYIRSFSKGQAPAPAQAAAPAPASPAH